MEKEKAMKVKTGDKFSIPKKNIFSRTIIFPNGKTSSEEYKTDDIFEAIEDTGEKDMTGWPIWIVKKPNGLESKWSLAHFFN